MAAAGAGFDESEPPVMEARAVISADPTSASPRPALSFHSVARSTRSSLPVTPSTRNPCFLLHDDDETWVTAGRKPETMPTRTPAPPPRDRRRPA